MGKVFHFVNPKPKVEPIYIPSTTDTDKERRQAEAKAREDALDRQRRGMESTIKTSYNGILDENAKFQRKKLLGE